MKLVVFGLVISSSWGNGHATLWRGLAKALHARGDRLVFYEHDVPYYASTRDYAAIPGGELVLYDDWEAVRHRAEADLATADVAMVTSFCPDALAATEAVLSARCIRVFYDLDTPVTLARLEAGEPVGYVGPLGLGGFDLVLSYTGGAALGLLKEKLGARRCAALYGHADPEAHRPGVPATRYRSAFSYLGTYSADRQAALQSLFIEPARMLSNERFVIAGALYPDHFPWCENIYFVRHLPPEEHPPFFASCRLTLNVTREPMRRLGWCPSGRLFEAAACGTAIISDVWAGLSDFFIPGEEILIAEDTGEALDALAVSEAELASIRAAARDRVLSEHTPAHRLADLDAALASVAGSAA